MPSNEAGEEAKPSGLFGRFFSKGKSPIRAKLGDENKFVYNEKLKRWVMPGEAIDESAAAPAPPPVSRVPSSGSVASDAEKRSDSGAMRGAAARYAAAGFAAPKPGASDASAASAAAFMPSPAKPPLGPPSKPAFFMPGAAPEGSAGALQPANQFFMPGGTGATQGAAPRFAGYRSQGQQGKRSPSGGRRGAAEDGPASKRGKGPEAEPEATSAAADTEVTLAHGMGAAPMTGSEVSCPAPGETAAAVQPMQCEESVGENTFGYTPGDDVAGDITSPGVKDSAVAGEASLADPEAMGGDASWAGAAMGSGLDDPLSQGDVGGNALDIEGSMSQQSAGNFSAEKTEEDWYREIQFHYNASLQQGYSAAETEEWLQQGYPTLMAGFLTWNQASNAGMANKAGPPHGHAEQPSVEAQAGEPASMKLYPDAAQAPGAHGSGISHQEDAQRKGTALSDHKESIQSIGKYQGSESRAHKQVFSEVRSDVADQGSIISDRDEMPKISTIGGRATESSASGKLTGPLPWDILDELSDDDDLSTTAGTPRYSWTLSNGEPALVDNSNPARPALAGAALAEAAEQAGGRIAGWVTNMVKSGALQQAVQQHLPMSMANNTRFPRPPTDLKNAATQSPTSVRSGGTSMLANAGTPTSIKSIPAESYHSEAQGQPQSATGVHSSNSATEARNPTLLEEQALPEEMLQDASSEHMGEEAPAVSMHTLQQSVPTADWQEAFDQQQEPKSSEQAQQASAEDAAAEDGWDLEESVLDGLGDAQPPQSKDEFGLDAEHSATTTIPPGQEFTAGSAAAMDVPGRAEGAYGNGSVTGMSPAGMSPTGAGWSELNFPLDDVPKEPKSAKGVPGREMDLPEGGKLKKLVVPPASPLRPIGSAALSQQPDSSAALQEALAHGDTAEKLAALQRRLDEVIAMHQQAVNESEALRDQNGTMEIELNDLKSRIDSDVLETRGLEEKLAVLPHLEEQLEEALQELEGLRAKTDALKADNFTMIAEQNDEPANNTTEEAPVEANGDAGTHSAHGIADTDPASLQRIAELEERNAELEENVEQLMTDLDNSMQDVVSRDEEIDKLEAKLAAGQGDAEWIEQLKKEANAANQEVVLLSDELETRDTLIEQLHQDLEAMKQQVDSQSKASEEQGAALAAREAELTQLRLESKSAGADSARVADLSTELAAAMSQAAEKAVEAEGLRKELKSAEASAAQTQADLAAELESQRALSEDAQHQIQALRHEVASLQEAYAAEAQARSKAESQLKTLQENARLDFERIGVLSEENTELKDEIEELKSSRETATSAELQQLQAAQESAHARLAEAEASINALTSEKETFAKRGAKLQARFNKLQAEAAKKQEQSAAQLSELQQKLGDALASGPDADSTALQDALDKVSAFEEKAAETEAREAEAHDKAAQAEQQLAEVSSRAQNAEQAGTEADRRAEEAERQLVEAALVADTRQAEAAAEAQRHIQEAESRARDAAEQMQQARARAEAAEQQLAQETEQRGIMERRAAELEATIRMLAADKADQESKVAELEEEASSMFERLSGLEEELGATQAESHAHLQALAAASAEVEELRSKVVEAPAVLEAAATPDKPEEDDLEALMSALGQEAEKVEKLIGLLQERGFDPTDILDEIEDRYAGEPGQDTEDGNAASPAAPEHSQGAEEPVLLHSNVVFDGSPGHDASQSFKVGSADESGHFEQLAQSPPHHCGFQGFSDEGAHNSEGRVEPEPVHQQAKGWGHDEEDAVDSSIAGLPEGELLSPPQVHQGKAEDLAAKIDFGRIAESAGDGWDDWDDNVGSSFA